MSMLVGKRERQDRLRWLLRRGLLGVFATVVTLALLYTAFRRWTYLAAPADDGPPLPANVKIDVGEQVFRISLADSWMVRQGGLWRLHLFGDPRLLGHVHGMLVTRVFEPLELALDERLRAKVPAGLPRWTFENKLRWQLRGLMSVVHPHRLAEVAAFSRTVVDAQPLAEDPFQRILTYHALPDVLQSRRRDPVFPSAAFAVWGKQSSGGHMLVGRSMELGLGPVFERERALQIVRGKGTIPFASLSWPGCMGVFSGVNAQRIFVAVALARTDVSLARGTPALFITREILERAKTFKQAISIAKKARPMGSAALLIADGNARQAAVIELDPDGVKLRRSSAGTLAMTNHLRHKKFEGDASNDWLRRYTPSEVRYKRLMQLLARFSGRLDPATAALILRNRTGLNDGPLAIGHRGALDSLRASHGLVVDVTALVLWVPKPPHLLGAMTAVDLKPLFGLASEAATLQEVGADPLLGSVALRRHRLVREQLLYAQRLRRAGARGAALDYARRASEGAPKLPEARMLLGDLYWDAGRKEEARTQYRALLELSPPYREEAERVRGRLAQ